MILADVSLSAAATGSVPAPATGAGQPVLRVENLTTTLFLKQGPLRAVEDVSFSVYPGETLGIVGESGCGKSMTALSVMGLLPRGLGRITAGSVEIAGVGDITRLSERQMRRIRGNDVSMIFQEPMTSLNPVFRIGYQIGEAFRAHTDVSTAEARRLSIEMLRKVGIPLPEERHDSFPHQLSGGMRQRVMIAMALACRPQVMLADEPTTALDVTIQAQVLKLMAQLKQDIGTSIVLITHDLGLVARNTQRVVVMYAGVVVEEAEVNALFADPLHPYTQGLMRSIPRIGATQRRQRLNAIEGTVPSLKYLPPGCRFSDRCPLVFDLCRSKAPPLAAPAGPTGSARKVRCWLHQERP